MAAARPSNQPKLYAAYGLFWFSFLFIIIALGAPNWSGISQNRPVSGGGVLPVKAYHGLWRVCVNVAGLVVCQDLSCTSTSGDGGDCSKLDATRTFTILSFFGMFFCSIVLTVYIFLEKLTAKGFNIPTMHANNKKVVMGFLGFTNFLIMLAWAIYASIDPGGGSYDFCFVFMILVSIFMFGIMALIWFTDVEGRAGSPNTMPGTEVEGRAAGTANTNTGTTLAEPASPTAPNA
jgi:hypothetical protein